MIWFDSTQDTHQLHYKAQSTVSGSMHGCIVFSCPFQMLSVNQMTDFMTLKGLDKKHFKKCFLSLKSLKQLISKLKLSKLK